MSDLPHHQDTLAGLIEDALDPPTSGSRGRLVRGLRSALDRATRPRAVHQERVDRAFAAALADQHSALQQINGELVDQQSVVEQLSGEIAGALAELRSVRAWLATTSSRGDETAGRLEAWITDQTTEGAALLEELVRLDRRVPESVALPGVGGPLERFNTAWGGDVVGFRGGGRDVGEGIYLGFENLFRGTEETIRERQSEYLPLLRGRGRVLDVGCGRGEMLELLRGHDIEAEGVDLDGSMVEHCRRKGIPDVRIADAVEDLESRDPGSLGAVFAAQLIEHLSYDDLLRFLQAARRALVSGGVLVAETVNPHSPQALKHFWIDPTHHHPLFPEVMVALCWLSGFGAAYIAHPGGDGDPDRDRTERMDYALIAEPVGNA